MPKRTDIKKILIIGSGPIIIGQACEFDYSGTQACKALREEGYQVVLVNSNPATIMTDPEMADRTYIEPITWEYVAEIIRIERPDALLPTLGGQTGLNTAMALHKNGILEKYGVEMIGAKPEAIHKAEDRLAFKQAMEKIGLDLPKSKQIHNLDEARDVLDLVGLPCILRPSFTLGGTGGGIAYNRTEFFDMIARGLNLSPVHSVLVEESCLGWKEYELEVMRDHADNVVIICSIENLDPMGVHTGDSITVAPAQTLTDKEYQRMRDASLRVIREIGVETGGSNIQFAINPANGRMIVIEMNPRVSRSSALASKATGFPIAKIAAKLAVGYRLDELKNDITRETPACFEPTIDYVVTKIPRWAFEKFPDADATLTTQMKSVGETMAIGRTFKESLQKALRGLETGHFGLGSHRFDRWGTPKQPTIEEIEHKLATPNAERIFFLRYAMKAGMSLDAIHQRTKIDMWFLNHIADIVAMEEELRQMANFDQVTEPILRRAKQFGFSDKQLCNIWNVSESEVKQKRREYGILPVFKLVDTCAAEFEAYTPYYYSTYDAAPKQFGGGEVLVENEVKPKGNKKRIMILGGGPNRIGQGIEFDYCCCQASFALKEAGYETIMVNSNPETVSTDYDTSDMLFFEPLTAEDVLHIVEEVKPDGIIVQFGGQTPLNLAKALEAANAPIIGTSVDSIDVAEDRERFSELVNTLKLKQPPSGIAYDVGSANRIAQRIGYPVLVRPSYVLGGRAMEIVGEQRGLEQYVSRAVDVSPGKPILIDRFLDNAIEVDVDCLADGRDVIVGGVMQHIEEAGIHSGDSACVLPPYSLTPEITEEIKRQTRQLALALNVQGLMNVQFAVANFKAFGNNDNQAEKPVIYILEVNPRASRTSPFVSKAIGLPMPKVASLIMVGKTLRELGVTREITPPYYSVKESVFPFNKFPGVDIILGPEMKSTGEVMGIDEDFAVAFAKTQLASNNPLPKNGLIFISVADRDKEVAVPIGKRFVELGYDLVATMGTMRALHAAGVKCREINKISTGRPNLLDLLENDQVALIINTPSSRISRSDERKIRSAAVTRGVTCITTISAAQAAVAACSALQGSTVKVKSLQERLKLLSPST
ncbi:MAG: carbamoyl-phosphate synthase large subunit [Planctomycetia bacterium]|nr:carbamoyl-phosphate synthase large subunit [Planctomycetia bacterium]